MFFYRIFLLILDLKLLTASHDNTLANRQQENKYPDVVSCLKAIEDPLLTPESPEWTEAIKPYNLRIAPIPAAVITPKDVKSAQDVMACARLFPGTRLSPLCGGHSFVSYGLGGTDGAVVVSMKSFKKIQMVTPRVVRVGGGVLVRELTVFLLNNGGLQWAHARGSEVGIVGSAIGGAVGTASRLIGSTLDTVVALDIILPDGNLTHATAEENADIFFAVLGAGSSFGIITSLDIKVFEAYPNPVTYKYQWDKPTLNQSVMTFKAFQDYGINQAPPELYIRLGTALPSNVRYEGVYYGDIKQFEDIMKPLLSQLSPPDVANATLCSVLKADNNHLLFLPRRAVTYAESEVTLSGSLDGPPATRPSAATYTNSLLTFEPIPDNTIQEFMSNLMARSEEKKSIDFRMQQFFDLWGGYESYNSKMTAKDEGTYAFPHTKALLVFRADGVLKNATNIGAWPSDGISFVQSFTKPLFDSQKSPRSYINYRDSAYTEEQWSSRYYSDQYPKLQQIKAHLDPAGIMSANPQSIQPSPGGV
ncbi:uncharacterized protein MELLADRAFT_77672 [Melampsora larici-populina 98AG31]|uniref:FAD-binding PCMH-type domain-containing protein n=1 Tax=Melampsora larici-populina (strain 98AG31 / pathotype 3-4-7) TaxID=747676 RepID=F4RKG2_MELLP|nr:uncharacterized protein MELLADRAFT_77672 [Melampsora larici-populina 98AG31]EGG07090.1 hypothetical protein MELLADRAFT_77672 [Melampsora larici-populina 98AG31]